MKRLVCLLLCLCLLTGCGAQTGAPANGVTFTDDLGRTVTVDAPQRVAALLGSYAQIWMLAGGTVCATADDAWDDFNLDLPADTINLGSTKSLSLELLLQSEPDFIIASTNTRQHIEWQDTLEATGIPVAYFDVADFDGYLHMLDICTQITKQPEHYSTYGLDIQTQIDEVLAASAARLKTQPAPTVLTMRASASSITVKNSQGNVMGEMLASLGCVNIADSDTSLLENLSIEHILQADPDFIFFVQQGDDAAGMQAYVTQFIADHPAWQQLTAVQAGRVYHMDKHLYNLKPNHRWGEAYAQMEEILANG